MIKIASRQIFIFFFDFFKKNLGPSNMGTIVPSLVFRLNIERVDLLNKKLSGLDSVCQIKAKKYLKKT